jgi:hypothetical protein
VNFHGEGNRNRWRVVEDTLIYIKFGGALKIREGMMNMNLKLLGYGCISLSQSRWIASNMRYSFLVRMNTEDN